MENFNIQLKNYIQFCQTQKCLDIKTIRAYNIDISQFASHINYSDFDDITPKHIESYIAYLHSSYKPKSAKRKIASIKAFFHYCEFKEIINQNPFDKVEIRFREPITLPKTISLQTLELFLSTIYNQYASATTPYKRKKALRDIAVAELLFSTGMRISELCNLSPSDVNLNDNIVLIYGKGAKERKMQIGNTNVVNILIEYKNIYSSEISKCNHFFVNQSGTPLSDQTVRRMINKYTFLASIEQHITPHGRVIIRTS